MNTGIERIVTTELSVVTLRAGAEGLAQESVEKGWRRDRHSLTCEILRREDPGCALPEVTRLAQVAADSDTCPHWGQWKRAGSSTEHLAVDAVAAKSNRTCPCTRTPDA